MTAGERRRSLGPALALIALAVGVGVRRMADPDLPWHLATGRIIAATRSLPRTDDLSFTHQPVRYVESVSDALLYALYALGGPVTLQALAGLLALAVALVAWRRAAGAGPIAALFAALLVASMGPWLITRPATLSFALLGLALLALEAHRAAPGTPHGRRALWALVPLHALWANVHGFVVVSVAITALYAGARVAARLLPREPWLPRRDGTDVRTALLVALGVVLATCLNPAGPRLLLGPGAAFADWQRIGEWRPPTLELVIDFVPQVIVLLLAVLAAPLLGRGGDGQRGIDLFELGLLVLGVALACSAVRLIALGAVLVTPIAARRIAARLDAELLTRAPLWAAATLAPLGALGLVLLDPGLEVGRGFALTHYPVGAVGWARAAQPQSRPWNHLPYGGWLTWELYPGVRTLVDGRTGFVHAPDVVDLAIRSEDDAGAWSQLVQRFDLGWAVTRSTEGLPFGAALAGDPGWVMVFVDDTSAVYVRRDGGDAALARDGYRLLRHDVQRRELLDAAPQLRRDRGADLAADAEHALRDAPNSSRAAFWLGCAAIATRDSALLARARGLLQRDASQSGAIQALEVTWRAPKNQ